MLARVCLHSLCFSMHCRGKVSEESPHVASGCESFHLETNAFPLQWAFSLLGICVYTSVSEIRKLCTESKAACVCVRLQEAWTIAIHVPAVQSDAEVYINPNCIYATI